MDELVARQRKLIHQLQEFQKDLAVIKEELNAKGQQVQGKTQVTSAKGAALVKTKNVALTTIDTSQLKEIVVHTSPNQVPYSLLGLQKLWSDRLNLVINSFTHSTVKKMTEEAFTFVKTTKTFVPEPDLPTLKISVIFKDIGTLQFISSPTAYFALQGEINLLRYLSRIGPAEFNYELNDANEADIVLDASYSLLFARSAKEKMDIVRLLNTKLGKQQYYGGESLNIIDLAVSSAIRQSKLTKEIVPALKAWLGRTEKIFDY